MADPTPVPVPRDNVNDEVVILVRWHVEPGVRVAAEQLIAEIETSKTVVEVHAPRGGVVHHWHPAGREVAVGDTLCVIADDLAAAEAAAPAATVPRAAAVDRPADQPQERHDAPRPGHASLRLSAAAAAVARDRGIDTTSLAGRGLVRARDLAGAGTPPVPGPAAAAARIVADVPGTREPLPRRKLAEVRALAGGAADALPSWVSIACPTRGLRRLAADRPDMQGNATALVVFEVARLLRQFPVFNAVFDDGAIRRYQEVNIGFAVDAGHGLKVPVIHAADKKPLAVVAQEMQQAIYDYLENTLPLASLARGTFCVSDLSGEEVTQFQPLISEGQSAILGIGAEWFPGGTAGPGSYSLVLAFDHRVAEGRVAGRFLRSLRDRLAAHEDTMLSGRDAGHVPGAGAAPTPACSRCGRGGPELVPLNGVMVATVHPPGFVCSLCLGGF